MTLRRSLPSVVALGGLLLSAPAASAQEDLSAARTTATATSAGTGAFLPFTLSPAIDKQSALGAAVGGYDGAHQAGVFEAAAEVRVFGPVALRGGAVYSSAGDRLRPSLGARVQALREGRHGLDGAIGVAYRPEGLTELEGEVEAVLSLGAHLGLTYLTGNLVYGQDPEGNERDGEVRLAALHPLGRFLVGADARLRFDLGSQPAKQEARLDAVVGPVASMVAGPVALLLQGGASALKLQGTPTTVGALVLGGVGASF
ncbi:MAG TPA: hypothetical protein VN914_21295 [Polyangia bacterium]|nr:hypothetical protein [Polyangia bacterium]